MNESVLSLTEIKHHTIGLPKLVFTLVYN